MFFNPESIGDGLCGFDIENGAPEVSTLTDEDSGDKENDGDLDRVSGLQLRVHVEVKSGNNQRIGSSDEIAEVRE
ncbi:hypothetical protein JTB14_009245 [Gonioctena quinquepunctata]|nr:hypothetical protein JTB14_009245 [Gonioctena quinquepunctata]